MLFLYSLRPAHTRGLSPATSLCNKSREQVQSRELAINTSKSSRKDQTVTSPINSNQFKFLGEVLAPVSWAETPSKSDHVY